MPTNYNFTDNDIFGKLFPNISSGEAFKIYGDRSTFTNSNTYTISTEKSPFGTPACRIVNPGAVSSTVFLSTEVNISQNPPFSSTSNIITKCTSPRSYTISFYVKGITYPPGALIRAYLDWENSAGSGFSSSSSSIPLDGSWQYINFIQTIDASSQVLTNPYEYGSLNMLLLNMTAGFANETLIADLKVTDSTITTTTSFDDQFIPADTFRQGNLLLAGETTQGQLGDSPIFSSSYKSSLVQEFTKSSNWKDVSIGFYHTAAIKTDGTLWTWGDNITGQLGINSSSDKRTPVQEWTSSNNWVTLSAGGGTSEGIVAAIKSDGTMWLWGDNRWGQIGIGVTGGTIRTPVQEITSSSNWKYVNVAASNTSAIKTDGTMWEWGVLYPSRWGQPQSYSPTPVQEISRSTNWKKVISGQYGLKTDGTFWVWGSGTYKPGLGINTYHTSPVKASNDTWKDIAENNDQTGHGIKTNGTLWSWGRGDGGSLGNNSNSSTFGGLVQEVTYSSNWTKVFGGECVAAIKTDGTLWVWGGGFGYTGALGLNNMIRYSSPILHPSNDSIKGWKKVVFDGGNADFGAFLTYIDPII